MTDIGQWLEQHGLGKYAEVFAKNDIDVDLLPHLTDEDIDGLGLPIGAKRRLKLALQDLAGTTYDASREGSGTKPPGVVEQSSEAERRQLTVMFCDLVGSTALSEGMDPEEFREVIAAYQSAVKKAIGQYDGYIARYMGDGVLLYFGYPHAHEDDAERAVRAGLGIVDSIRRLEIPGDIKLEVRVGIATGLVVAGDIIGEGASEEHAVLGDTPNLAARLQGVASPNAVVISESTQRLVEGLFVFDHLGVRSLKGISAPVAAYRVRAESEAPSRFEAAARRGLTPLVGREEEVGLLLKRWAQARDGEGQVVMLGGEAGVGKSRIVRAFQERVPGELGSRVLYFCSPFHQNSALYPAVGQFERGLHFEKGDEPEQKLDKLEAVLGELGLPVTELAPVLGSLLTVSVDGRYGSLELAPQELREQTFKALLAVFAAMACREPVLMAAEDAQWMDSSTQEFLRLLIEQVRSASMLIVVTFRPEFTPPWGGHAHMTSLALNRLGRRECEALVAKVAEGRALPPEVLDQVVAKTDGIPIFVEELTKMVLSSGLLKDRGGGLELAGPLQPLAIPASLQDSLMARLDRLTPVKELAQLAATIGRTFSRELLAAVALLPDNDLQDGLDMLVEAGLFYSRGVPPNVVYEFKHALVQDAAHQSLLRSRRREFHSRIAQALEAQFPETVRAEPELLAHHYTEAGLPEQAVEYWHRSGRRAGERSANLEAIAHLNKGLELLGSLPQSPERAAKELALQLDLGPALMETKGIASPEVGSTYHRAQALSHDVGEQAHVYSTTWGLWLHYQQASQLERAQELLEELLVLAERQSDPGVTLQAHHAAWTTFFSLGDWPRVAEHAERGISLYKPDKHHAHRFVYGGHDPGICAGGHAALSAWCLGLPDRALERARDFLALAETLAHPFTLARARLHASVVYQYCRDGGIDQFDEARDDVLIFGTDLLNRDNIELPCNTG